MKHLKTTQGTYTLAYATTAPVHGLNTYAPTIAHARKLARIAMRNPSIARVTIHKMIEVFRHE